MSFFSVLALRFDLAHVLQEANCFLAFNLDAELTLAQRKDFLEGLCRRFGQDRIAVCKEFFGNGVSTGRFQCAVLGFCIHT